MKFFKNEIVLQWVGTKQQEFGVNSMQLLNYQVTGFLKDFHKNGCTSLVSKSAIHFDIFSGYF